MTNLIHKQMIAVMRKIGSIGKERKASMGVAGSYNFRGIDDVYNVLHPIMAEEGVFCCPTVLEERSEEAVTKSGSRQIYRIIKVEFKFYAEDGSFVSIITIGEGMDSGDKATNKAMSAAQKYAILQAFLIPTQEAKDSENDQHDLEPKIYKGTADQISWVKEWCDKLGFSDVQVVSQRLMNQPIEKIDAWFKSQKKAEPAK